MSLTALLAKGTRSGAIIGIILASTPNPIDAAPASSQLNLQIQRSTNNQVTLGWLARTNFAFQLESTHSFSDWKLIAPPVAAPDGGGLISANLEIEKPREFFRVRLLSLKESPVPSTVGHHPGLDMVHEGLPRTYRLYIPTNYNGTTPTPLALILHGSGQSGDAFAGLHPDLFDEADRQGMILVLPDALFRSTKTGWSKQPLNDGPFYVDDASFLLGLIDRLAANLNIDLKRVYAGGFSGGGVMSHYLGSVTTNVFAALSAVGSGLSAIDPRFPATYTNLPPAGPMPVLLVNATNDCGWSYWGGLNEKGRINYAAIEAAWHWTNANLCVPPPTVMTNVVVTSGIRRFNDCGPKPPANQVQTNLVVTMRWASCTPGTEVIFVTLTDGGHLWPDANDRIGFDANRTVLSFFSRHTRP